MSHAVMVLRSFHLPRFLDDKLRDVAFYNRRSKADIMRQFIFDGLEKHGALESESIGDLPRIEISSQIDKFTQIERHAIDGGLKRADLELRQEIEDQERGRHER